MTQRHPAQVLLRHAALGCLLAAALACGAARADDYDDVQQLQASGDTRAALELADRHIAAHPNDPQMRFIKANVLSASGDAGDARDMLEQLTARYPELAEPWNNLAVLYAAQGELDAARAALDSALRIQPDYAVALENRADILARLALRDYEHARRTDEHNTRVAAKIAVLREMLAAGGSAP